LETGDKIDFSKIVKYIENDPKKYSLDESNIERRANR